MNILIYLEVPTLYIQKEVGKTEGGKDALMSEWSWNKEQELQRNAGLCS